MTTFVTTGNLLNPSISGLNFGMYPAGSMSQYLDAYSVFNTNSAMNSPMFGGIGCMGGFGMNNANFYNNMAANSDNMTSLQFKFRSNQHALGSYNEIMQKNLTEMATALRNGEMGKASRIYDEVYQAIGKNYGEEITTQEQRVAYDQSIKATITNLYQQVNGYPLANDINENGEGYFENGFMQGLTLGNHHKNSSEETESYMTGTSIEGYRSKQFAKTVGKVLGGTISVGAAAGIGFACGGVVGAAIGAGVALLGGLISNNSTTKVTEA